MAVELPGVQPPPDPRAILAVLEARRRSESGSRAELTSAALEIARGQDIGDLQIRRAAEAYADAVEGFTRPRASTGYVLAGFYAMRRRVALWIGIPFFLLLTVGGLLWGYDAFERARHLDQIRVSVRKELKAARQRFEEAAGSAVLLDRLVREERPVPPNMNEVQKHLIALDELRKRIGAHLDDADSQNPRDERRVRRLRADSGHLMEDVDDLERDLKQTQELFLRGRELVRVRGLLDAGLIQAKSLSPAPPLTEALAIHERGTAALDRGDVETASQSIAALAQWVKLERETAEIPGKLQDLLGSVKVLTRDEEALSKAAALHRQGRWAFERSERLQARESVQQLTELVGKLSEEYTLVITGGKWRFKNSDPSVRNYYVLVEAVDPNGVRLSKYVRNEEDGTGATVKQWGERVPFAIYERVRKDKQDNGRIDQNVFGRKQRGRLEVEIELRTDEGEVLPRSGQITRW